MKPVKSAPALIAFMLVLTCSLGVWAQSKPDEAAKNFFKSVAAQDYKTSWTLLSAASQKYFIDTLAKAAKLDSSKISPLFVNNDAQVRGFWDSFRTSSKSEYLAKVSTYKVESVKGKEALVKMHFPQRDVDLKMKNEGGWKLGYKETFIK